MTRRRILTWAIVGLAAASAVMLKDLGLLLGEIQTSGSRSYDASVFTGPHLVFWDTGELQDAIEVWRLEREVVEGLLSWHFGADVIFALALGVVVWMALRASGAQPEFARSAGRLYAALDVVENVVTLFVLRPLVGGTTPVGRSPGLVAIQLLALLKWAVLLTAAVVAVVALFERLRDRPEGDRHRPVARARRGGVQAPAQALASLIVLVTLFVALVALPAGGPLDQIPDVIRQHLAEGGLGLWTLSTFGLLLFLAAVSVAGLAATSPAGRTAQDATIPDRVVLAVAAGASGLFALISVWRGSGLHKGLAAPVVVVGALWLAAAIARWAGVVPAAPTPPREKALATWTDASILWVGGLAGAVAVAGSLGLVRAAFPPWVLGIDDGRWPWWAAATVGFLGSAVAGGATQAAVHLVARRSRRLHLVVAGVVVGSVVVVAAGLAVAPDWGASWGSTGVVGAGFGLWALVIGGLIWLSRTRPRWDVTRQVGFGARTPWFTLLLVVGLVGSSLGKDAGYHDARLVAQAHVAQHPELDTVFSSWRGAVTEECAPQAGEPIPMVFVAAPGGGIRAAYWTVSVLEKLFPGRCAATHLFAVSGVSGGSVGAATWVTARGLERSPTAAVTAMSEDVALPATLAGLLLRDVPQPLTGIADAWDDRAALLERGWADASGIFGSDDDPTPWSEAGDGGGLAFVPLVMLNGSSVTDACRVVTGNVAGLPASTGPDCQGVPSPGNPVAGPETGTIDPFVGLRARGSDACGGGVDVPTTTAALLSARFPFVSPSGVIERCVETGGGKETISSNVVDGGYYENSGLLTSLQLWAALDEEVAGHNEGNPANPVQPWFVLVDNHYRATAKKVPPGSPMELLVPLEGFQQKVLTQTMLEQESVWEMTDDGGEPRFVYLAPTVRLGVEAPLGWVLSSVSRDDLDTQLEEILEDPGPVLEELLDLLS